MDLAQFAGADYAEVSIDGHPFKVGELTLGEWAPVQAWIKANAPGPLSSLGSRDFRELPPDVKRELLGLALDRDRTSWPPPIGTRAWFLALDHEGGHVAALRAILRKHLPEITPEDCGRLVEHATFEEILPAFAAALGIFGPKSPAPPPGAKVTAAAKKRGRTTSATSPISSPKPTGGRRRNSSGSPSGNSGITA